MNKETRKKPRESQNSIVCCESIDHGFLELLDFLYECHSINYCDLLDQVRLQCRRKRLSHPQAVDTQRQRQASHSRFNAAETVDNALESA